MAITATYDIHLPQFDGPFDLLLFFIERDELDIYDIPIYKITTDFLDYLHQMDTLNIEMASEFILVASTLMRIKAKMLLPRKELDEQGHEIDPRNELVNRLLEYKKYKTVVEDMKLMEEQRAKLFDRGNTEADIMNLSQYADPDAELHSLTLFKLMKAFKKVLEKQLDRETNIQHQVIRYPYTIEEEKTRLLTRLRSTNGELAFEKIFDHVEDRIHAIFIFLSLLELIQQRVLKLTLGEGMNNFWLEAA